jgi:ADP-L-glycero-D-manno-heptose 6-epimerase
MSRNTIVITGGAGFIGSNIAARLSARGDCEVVVCDLFGSTQDDKWRNLAGHAIANVLHPDALFDWLEDNWHDVQAIIHMGAISATTETDVDLIVRTNITLSRNVWDWCVKRQRPLIYASSAATYGSGEQGFVDQNTLGEVRALRPLNAYGWSKRLFDEMALTRSGRGDAPPMWAGLRFFNVYGPNEYHKGGQKSVVASIFPRVQSGDGVTLFKSHHPDYADGGQLRDFIYVRDCVDVVEWLLESGTHAGIINVGTGTARSFLDLAHATFAAASAKAKVSYVDTPEAIRANYQYYTQADLTRLRSLGFGGQFTPLEDGIRDYVEGYLLKANAYL